MAEQNTNKTNRYIESDIPCVAVHHDHYPEGSQYTYVELQSDSKVCSMTIEEARRLMCMLAEQIAMAQYIEKKTWA